MEIRGYCCLTNIWDTIWWIPWCLRNTPSRGQKSPLSIPGLWLVSWSHPAFPLAAQVSSWNLWHHGTGLPGQAVTRNYNGDQFSREPGKWGREDLWSWYKLSSDAWSNYQWSCALAPCRYFQKAILTLLFSLSGEFIHLVLLLATWRPFLLNQRKREFPPVCSSHLQCSNYAVMRHLQLCKNVFIFISFCLMPISRSLSIAVTKW